MMTLKLFTDASVNPQSKIGYGAYLSIPPEPLSFVINIDNVGSVENCFASLCPTAC